MEMVKSKEPSLEELKSKLEDLENQEFMLEMIDTWTSEDYKYSDEIHEQIMAVKKEIEKRSWLEWTKPKF